MKKNSQNNIVGLRYSQAWLLIIICLSIFLIIFLLLILNDIKQRMVSADPRSRFTFWEIQSIDTMKYSRDLAREKAHDADFDNVIDETMRRIASAGATHAAIGTAYDNEFIPFMERWVKAARKYNLHVWFRGNWSGWEGWFDYQPISQENHIKKTKSFIADHPLLFADGDIFTACPECENGQIGDPRQTGNVEEFRQFLIDERLAVVEAFKDTNKQVRSNLTSMNGDVARLVMDKKTTALLGGVVTIDHYVATPEKLIKDIKDLMAFSGGQIVLGEFGAPIPEINAKMDIEEQAEWIKEALSQLAADKNIIGLNYWISSGGSTELWSGDGILRPAYYTLSSFYKPMVWEGIVKNEAGKPLDKCIVSYGNISVETNNDGYFSILAPLNESSNISFKSPGYFDIIISPAKNYQIINTTLIKQNSDLWYSIKKQIKKINDRLYKIEK